MKTLNQIKAERLRKIADEIIKFNNSKQTSYFNYRLRYNLGKIVNAPLEKVVVPKEPMILSAGSILLRTKEVPTQGLKLWDCGSRKQGLAILAEL